MEKLIERYFKERKDIFVKSMGRGKIDYRLKKVLEPKIDQFSNDDHKELNNISFTLTWQHRP